MEQAYISSSYARSERKKKKKETSQSGNAALKEVSCQDRKMSPGAWLPLPSCDTGEKGSLRSDLPVKPERLLKPQRRGAWPAPDTSAQAPINSQSSL